MVFIKKILFRLLGLKRYLRLMNRGFYFFYNAGFLKKNEQYKFHYFDQCLIREGDYIVDIGANLGYYTLNFSKWVGKTGKVFAVEPVPVFFETIQWAARKANNIKFLNYALGEEDKEVTLATPGKFGYIRTGLPQVVDPSRDHNQYEFSFQAQMRRASVLFQNLPRLDFIKCDIEGYEHIVLPEMKDILQRLKPTVQVEIWDENKPAMKDFFSGIGYKVYCLEKGVLQPLENVKEEPEGDLLFIHGDNQELINRLREIKKMEGSKNN